MGVCCSSDSATSSSTGPQRGASREPLQYAKNQVVPVDGEDVAKATRPTSAQRPLVTDLHLSSTEDDSSGTLSSASAGTQPLLAAAAADSLQAVSATPQQGSAAGEEPAGFLKELLDACRCKPSDFGAFSRGCQAIGRSSAPFFQRQAHAALPLATLTRAAEAAAAALQHAIAPVLAGVDRALSNASSGGSGTAAGGAAQCTSRCPDWHNAELPYLMDSLEGAARGAYGADLVALGAALLPLLEVLCELQQHAARHRVAVPPALYLVPAASRLVMMLGVIYFRQVVLEDAESLQSKLEGFQQLRDRLGWQDRHLAVVLDGPAKALVLHLRQAAPAGERRLAFTVRRSCAFWDAYGETVPQGLLQGVASGVCYKVFPTFIEELAGAPASRDSVASPAKPRLEAGEGHGPRKEFFAAAGADMTGQVEGPAASAATASGGGSGRSAALFVYNRSAGAFWYNTELEQSTEMQAAYQFAGWLMGQSVLNKAPLAARWPAALFAAALEGPAYAPTLSDLADFDPAASSSLRVAAALPAGQLRDLMALEELPASTTAEQYVSHSVQALLVEAPGWRAAALRAGLLRALDAAVLATWAVSPAQLAAVLAGGAGAEDDEFDVPRLFRVVLDEEMAGRSASLPPLLWSVLAAWPPALRRRFLAFVTGSDRLPAPGSELLRVEAPFVPLGAAEHKAMLGMLPQAHTCDNLLELPNYWASMAALRGLKDPAASLPAAQLADFTAEVRAVLEDRLAMAVANFSGYGLDQRGSSAGAGGSSAGTAGGGDLAARSGRGAAPDGGPRGGRRGALMESTKSVHSLLLVEGPIGQSMSPKKGFSSAAAAMPFSMPWSISGAGSGAGAVSVAGEGGPRAPLPAPAVRGVLFPLLPPAILPPLKSSAGGAPAAALSSRAAQTLAVPLFLRSAVVPTHGASDGALSELDTNSHGGAAALAARPAAPAALPHRGRSANRTNTASAPTDSPITLPPGGVRAAYAEVAAPPAAATASPSFHSIADAKPALTTTLRRMQPPPVVTVFDSIESLGGFSVPGSDFGGTSTLEASGGGASKLRPSGGGRAPAALAVPRRLRPSSCGDTDDLTDVVEQFRRLQTESP